MSDFFIYAKPLEPEAPSYAERGADKELYEALIRGEFCHVLSPPQTGKTSLMVRTAYRLREYFRVVTVDLNAIGTNLGAEEWYEKMLRCFAADLGLQAEFDSFFKSHPEARRANGFIKAMKEVVLAGRSGPLVVFLDGIETLRALPFSTDEFIEAIRDCHDARANSEEFKRLTFCLLGSAGPSQFSHGLQSKTFAFSRHVELNDFSEPEAARLAPGLKRSEHDARLLLAAAMHWTNGHPYLTQRLCQRIASDDRVRRPADVSTLCEEMFFSAQGASDDLNIQAIRDRILKSEADLVNVLALYEQIQNNRPIADNEANRALQVLRYSGLTRGAGGFFQARNRIYGRVFDLEWIASTLKGAGKSGSKPPPPKSIAVLPFVNSSSDLENEFLSDGITEDLITALSQVEGLRVPARTSSFALKGKREDIRRIGEQLNVATILEGSVRKSGHKLRITAQLINVADGYHLWSEKYDREMRDVFAIQDEITQSIVEALKGQLAASSEASFTKRQTVSTEAYQLYLKGRYFWNQRGAGLLKGGHYFELALLEDLNYALAYTGVADTYTLLGFYGRLPSKEARAKAKAAALQAVALNANLAEARSSLGFVKFVFDWDWAGAQTEFEKALDLNPHYVLARNWHARLLSTIGDHDNAIAEDRRALESDPLSAYANMHLGWMFLNARRYDDAIRQLHRAVEMRPTGLRARCLLGLAYLFQHRITEATAELQQAGADSKQNEWALALLGYAQGVAGQRAEAEASLLQLKERSEREYIRPTLFALIYMGLNDHDQAITWLDSAVTERDCWLPLVKSDPAFDPMRTDPRFVGIMKLIGWG